MSTNKTFSRLQLEAARKKLWHQDGAGLLTLDAAAEWLEIAGLVPYLPLGIQLPAPAPSFVEAVLGRPEKGHIVAPEEPLEEVSLAVEVEEREPEEAEAEESAQEGASEEETSETAAEEENLTEEPVAPSTIDGFSPDEMETAKRMLARLVSEGAAVPLRLLGGVGDAPDFVCSPQVFSFVYTLRGDKGWKQPPVTTGAGKVSPLALHVWEAIKEKDLAKVSDLTAEMGGGITQAAVGRALGELWSILRVMPVPSIENETEWELLTGRFVRHIKAGSNAGQPTALSALLSLYLGQAIAATSEEAEVFLSPLAPRSKVREIVNALSGQRQLESNIIDGKANYYIPGTLPEFEDIEEPVVEEVEQVSRYERPERPSKYPVRVPAGKRRTETGEAGEGEGGFERKPFRPREGAGDRRRSFGGDRPAFSRREGGDRPFRERKPFTPREGGERKPFRPREEGGERRSFAPRGEGERRPYQRRESGDRPFRERKPFTPREGGDRKPFRPREEGGERRGFAPRGEGERRPYQRREGGDRPFRERKPFTPREGGDRKPFATREGGDRKPFRSREEGGERRPFKPREGGFGKRDGGFKKSGFGAKRGPSAGAKFGGKSSGFAKKKGGPVSRKGPGFGPGRGGAPKRRGGDE